MMPLTLSHSMINKAIRAKKKKIATSEPEIAGTSPTPDMNAQDAYDIEQAARVEETLDSPKKINADDADMEDDDENVGLTAKEKMRMGRLRKYFDAQDLDW